MSNKASFRKVIISGLANKRVGNELVDSIEGLQLDSAKLLETINALITLLETNKADISAVDFESLLITE